MFSVFVFCALRLFTRGARTPRQAARWRRSAGLYPRHSAAGALEAQSASDHGRPSVVPSPTVTTIAPPTRHIASVVIRHHNSPYELLTDHNLVHCTLSKPAPNLTCDCLPELSVRVLCFIDNITCTSRARDLF